MKKDIYKKRILNIYMWIIVIGALYYLFITYTGFGIKCTIYELTGLRCAGCGGTHMVKYLLRGDVAKSFTANPILFISIGIWIIVSICYFVGSPRWIRNNKVLYTTIILNVCLGHLLGILRNFI